MTIISTQRGWNGGGNEGGRGMGEWEREGEGKLSEQRYNIIMNVYNSLYIQ